MPLQPPLPQDQPRCAGRGCTHKPVWETRRADKPLAMGLCDGCFADKATRWPMTAKRIKGR